MKTVYVYTHTHWDREWYREFEEFRLRLIEVFDDVLDKLQNAEIPNFYFDGQTLALQDYLEIHPEKITIIQNLIREKKLNIGPFYCSSDSFLVSSELMIRNLFFGLKISEKFNEKKFIAYIADSFGHSSSMPSVLKSFGIKNAILWRGLGNYPAEFNWNGIDTIYLIQGYFQDVFSLNLSYDEKAQIIKTQLDKIAEKSTNNILFPSGADHLKLADKIPHQIEELNKRLKDYKLVYSTPFDYINKVKANFTTKVNDEFLDNTRNFVLKGVYSSRIYQKIKNAKIQWDLTRISEPLTVIAKLFNKSKNWQSEIDYAYKMLLKNQAHDSIYGCSTDGVHKQVNQRFDNLNTITMGIKKRIIRDFSDNVDTLKVINLSNFNYSGCVEIVTDRKIDKRYNAQLISIERNFTDEKLYNPSQIPITEDITTIRKYLIDVKNLEPFSMSNITKKLNIHSDLKITDNSLENKYLRLEIKNKKIILKDIINNKIYENFITFTDRADIGDSYNFGALKNDKKISAKILSSKIKQKGQIQSILRINYEIDIPQKSTSKGRSKKTYKHKLYLDISLDNQAKYLEFNLDWENKSTNHILQAQFKFDTDINIVQNEDMIGIIERKFDPNYDIYKNIPAQIGIELKTNTAPMQRFLYLKNVGIMTKGLQEYEVFKNTLQITLLRATGIISEPKNTTRGTPAGPPIKCNDLQCLGHNNVSFAITFTDKSTTLYNRTEAYYKPTLTMFSDFSFDKLFDISNDKIIINALKYNEHENALILRLINISDKKETTELILNFQYKTIVKTDSLEKEIEKLNKELHLDSHEILTIKISL